MKNKGQAAMEFLMTYGWAILAAIIAIGVLAYFGVFSPGKYTPSATVVNPPFYATGANVNPSTVLVEVQNQGGEDLNVTSFAVNGCTTNSTAVWVNASERTVLSAAGCGLSTGDSFRGDVTITYRKAGSSLDLQSTGTIAQTVA